MGRMSLNLFKKIIDQAEGKVEFITLASRGEPLACRDIIPMLKYTKGKYLNLKLNTNASMLSEKICHAILSSNIKTIVFSADAADENSIRLWHGGARRHMEQGVRSRSLLPEQRLVFRCDARCARARGKIGGGNSSGRRGVASFQRRGMTFECISSSA